MQKLEKTINLFRLMLERGQCDYIGESINQINHMLQAAFVAESKQYASRVIIAALFHDIGHLLDAEQMPGGLGAKNHEILGADYLQSLGMKEEVHRLVRNHVNAKRYLVSFSPSYAAQLSAASLHTLQHQGGPMQKDEMKEFENLPFFHECLQLRRCDEEAKMPNACNLEEALLHFLPLVLEQFH